MVQFNFSERTIKAKVVYYGPAQSGKTTNLEQIHKLTDPQGNNRLISLNTAQDRTLFFDLLPFSLGAISGYDFKVQLYTVPGQVQYNATRRVVLAGADAVVFVADSRRAVSKENVTAFENMKVNLLANRLVPEKVPLVLQYNKQDLPDLQSPDELNKTLNFWKRPSFLAVAARGDGVLDTFIAVVKEMLQAIAVKYNLKEKGLDPASIPEVVDQAFTRLVQKAVREAPKTPLPAPAARVVIAHAPEGDGGAALQAAPDSGLVSEELLHRAIRSNVELAEVLAGLVQNVNAGLASILTQADLLIAHPDGASERRVASATAIRTETQRLRKVMQDLGQAGAAAAQEAPMAAPAAQVAAAPPPVPTALGSEAMLPIEPLSDAPQVDAAVRAAVAMVRGALDARGVSVELRLGSIALSPNVPAQSVTRAVAGLLQGLAPLSPSGSVVQIKAERKPVLLKARDGSEVKRDFLMLAASHGGVLSADQQQRALQGGDPGPIGLACRAVKQLGGFVRFAPLSGGGLETRFFLPAT